MTYLLLYLLWWFLSRQLLLAALCLLDDDPPMGHGVRAGIYCPALGDALVVLAVIVGIFIAGERVVSWIVDLRDHALSAADQVVSWALNYIRSHPLDPLGPTYIEKLMTKVKTWKSS